MNKKEIITKIKDLMSFGKNDETVETEVKFLEMKDMDGNILKIDGDVMEVGNELKIVSEAGEELAGEGEFKLDDGRVIKTDADSKISEISDAVEEETDVETEVSPEQMEEVVETEVTDETETETEVTEKETEVEEDNSIARIDALEELVKELLANQSKMTEATLSVVKLVEDFGGTPVEDEIEDLKSTFSSIKEDSKSVIDKNLEQIRKMRVK